MAEVTAGSLAKYRDPTQDDASPDNVGIVLEVASNTFDDGHTEEWVMIAPLTNVIHRSATDVVPLNQDVVPVVTAPTGSESTAASVLVPPTGDAFPPPPADTEVAK
jgi:hypothetical protein